MLISILRNTIVSLLVTFILIGSILAQDAEKPLVKSNFFTITQEDISLLRQRMLSFFETTETEYCRALIKIKLFAKQAREDKIDLEPDIAAQLSQLLEQKLSEIYMNRVMADYELLPGTVTSYYDSHPKEFTLEDGTLAPLNEALEKKIKTMFLEKKKSEMANKEMDRLMEKYQVDIINPVCNKKDRSNE